MLLTTTHHTLQNMKNVKGNLIQTYTILKNVNNQKLIQSQLRQKCYCLKVLRKYPCEQVNNK